MDNPGALLLGLGVAYIVLIILGVIASYFLYGLGLHLASMMILRNKPSFLRSQTASFLTLLFNIIAVVIVSAIVYLLAIPFSGSIVGAIITYILSAIVSIISYIAVPIVTIKFILDTEDRWGWAGGIYIISLVLTCIFVAIVATIISFILGGCATVLTFLAALIPH